MKKRLASCLGVAVLMLSAGLAAAPTASAAYSPNCYYTPFEPETGYLDQGLAVKQVQCQLSYAMRASNLARDGFFGDATWSDVYDFQVCAHITADGVVGPNTWHWLEYWAESSSYVC